MRKPNKCLNVCIVSELDIPQTVTSRGPPEALANGADFWLDEKIKLLNFEYIIK